MNPYNPPAQAAVFDKPDASLPGPVSWIVTVAWCYPFLMIGVLYATWGIASLVLGHPPRPSLDDPKKIGIVVDIAYYLTGVILIAFPAVAIVGALAPLLATMLAGNASWFRRVTRSVVLVILYVATIALLRWDPLHVLTWFMD